MSSEAVAWVWNLRGISASERNVLLRFAENSDHRGISTSEGYEVIGDLCEVSPRQVMRIVKRFEEGGLLTIERRRGKDSRQLPNVIQLHVIANVGGAESALSRVTSVTPGSPREPGDMPGDIPGDMGVTRLAVGLGGKGGDSRDTGRENSVVTSSDNLKQSPLALERGDIGGSPGHAGWFESVFWPRYPRKIAKGRAKRSIDRLKPNSGLRSRIMAALELAIAEWRRRGVEEKYIPYPATWLTDEPWADVPSQSAPMRNRTCACGCGLTGVVLSAGRWWARNHDPDGDVPRGSRT